jgi:AhpD family alkylhydroperoxidase
LVTRSRELVSGRRNGCSTCIHGHLQEAKNGRTGIAHAIRTGRV